MGLLNKRTLNKAKGLAMKNKEKIATGVSKATETVDKKTGGKHSDKLKKLDDAAAKFAGHPVEEGATADDPPEGTEPTATSADDSESKPADEPSR